MVYGLWSMVYGLWCMRKQKKTNLSNGEEELEKAINSLQKETGTNMESKNVNEIRCESFYKSIYSSNIDHDYHNETKPKTSAFLRQLKRC